ncbi:long-chain-fatty-acid--CoA ligase [mine drainage metagenome]|uniref:Long-chain-fatty-acid--CoA ligase n=1 Tax=mine drainage metagenome TaxID=410659 RepID=A0A1J5R6G2_9ZZZZ
MNGARSTGESLGPRSGVIIGCIAEDFGRNLGIATMPSCTQTLDVELERAAADAPQRPFVRFMHREWTYAEVWRDAQRAAAALHAAGVGAGDRVSLLLPNGIEFVVAWFALARLGAIAAPLNTEWRGATLADALALVGSRVLIVDAALWPALAGASVDWPGCVVVVGEMPADAPADALPWSALTTPSTAPPPPRRGHFADPALLLYTSGSSGRAKAAQLSHRFVLRQAECAIAGLELRTDDVLYCPYPMFHLDGAVLTLAPALLLRAVAAFGERFSAARYWDEVRALRATVFDFMGATLTLLWKQPPSPRDRDHRARLGWGVPLPPWSGEFEARFGCRLVELYGATEIGAVLYTPQSEPARPGRCGKPLGPFELALVDEDGFAVPPGVAGELLVRGTEPSVLMDGYWADPARTLHAMRDQWFHTGDLLRVDADGWYSFVGRRKDIVRRRGENIAAAEVEMLLEQHPSVLECAVLGVPSALSEEDLLACVVLRRGATLTPRVLADWCEGRMARFMIPRYLRFMSALPKTPTDKVEKFRLSELGLSGAWDRDATDQAA